MLENSQRRRRSRHRVFWRIINPPTRPLAALWVRNLEATSEVRIKMSGRWYDAPATVHDYEETIASRFNLYARTGPRTLGIEPAALVCVELADQRLIHH